MVDVLPLTDKEVEALYLKQNKRLVEVMVKTNEANQIAALTAQAMAVSIMRVLEGRGIAQRYELRVVMIQELFNLEQGLLQGKPPLLGGLSNEDFYRLQATLIHGVRPATEGNDGKGNG